MTEGTFGQRRAADTDGEVQRILEKLERSGNDLPILRLMANAGRAFRPFVLLSTALLHEGALPPRVREAVILHLAHRHQLGYEWHEHEPMALAAGLTPDDCALLAQGQDLDDADLQLARRFADDLLDRRDLTTTRAALLERLGPEATLELALVVGWWGGMVPAALRTLDGEGLPHHPWPPAPTPAAAAAS
ncbi:MAG: hypothetical protein JWN46_2241 [Acidimicrobiales bacterium]|nr:hypothetical protein [Acidimicrobiales bacterium]